MADGLLSYAGLKHKLYNMMKKYIETPKEIQDKIDLNREKINNISKIIQQQICNVDESYEKDILLDVQNLVENILRFHNRINKYLQRIKRLIRLCWQQKMKRNLCKAGGCAKRTITNEGSIL